MNSAILFERKNHNICSLATYKIKGCQGFWFRGTIGWAWLNTLNVLNKWSILLKPDFRQNFFFLFVGYN